MSWFDDVRGMSGRGRVRPQAQTTPPADQTYSYDGTSPVLPDGTPNPNYRGNTGVAGDQSTRDARGQSTTVTPASAAQTTPPAGGGASAFARTAENNPNLDPAKWAAGHVSPKYAWHEIGLQHDLTTQAGRDAALAQAKAQYPQWFGSASWSGDDFLNLGATPDAAWNGVTGFDAVYDASGETGNTRPWMGNETYAPGYGPASQGAGGGAAGVGGAVAGSAGAGATGGNSPMSMGAGGGTPVGASRGGGYGVDSGQGFGALMAPWEYEFAFPYFQAPEGEEVFNDPGYQFRQEQGNKAIQRSAAAQGTVLSPATVKALEEYNSGLASQEYGNVYNRRLGEHGRAHDQAFNEFSTAYNVFNRNQDVPFNRLAAIAGLGQTSAGQLGAAGSAFGANYGNTAMYGANAASDYMTQGANAQAAGRVGGANAWNSALTNIGNNAGQSYYNYQYFRPRTPQQSPFNFGTPVSISQPPGYGG